MSRSQTYSYCALPITSSFRVLKLQPGADTDPITYTLDFADWQNPPPYEAISYAWGDPTRSFQTVCNGQQQELSRSIWQALSRLRLHDKPRLLWADAICIDQTNLEERRHQVDNMKKIYEHATQVLVWLAHLMILDTGLLPKRLKDVDEFSNIIKQTSDDTYLTILEFARECEDPLRWFFSRPWLKRLWVIQEVNSGTSVLAICGQHTIDWQFIALSAEWLYYYQTVFVSLKLSQTNCLNAAFMRSLVFRIEYDILDVVGLARIFLTTDPRDKVYALLGLPNFSAQCGLMSADYSKTAEVVFRDFVEAIIQESGTLDVLSHVHHDERIKKPSWIPRWESTEGLILLNRGYLEWNAHNHIQKEIIIDKECCIIKVFGANLDCIVEKQEIEIDTLFPVRGMKPHDNATAFWEQTLSPSGSSDPDLFLRPFSMVFTCGLNISREHADETMHRDSFLKYLQFCNLNVTPVPRRSVENESGLEEFLTAARWICSGRSFFKTKQGYIGMGPELLQVEDIIAVFAGVGVPFVLCPGNDHYLLVGEAYVYGIMEGQLFKDSEGKDTGGPNMQYFEIH
ncbi:heterokaryon incompatibility protein-domain-containing protein [Bisporella sp. PMI_857]|nr:heterokaryon incompatibility protein-domain-containing protein [Bisporella sp. PMI_857]